MADAADATAALSAADVVDGDWSLLAVAPAAAADVDAPSPDYTQHPASSNISSSSITLAVSLNLITIAHWRYAALVIVLWCPALLSASVSALR